MKKYIPELDGLRGIGVFIALGAHYGFFQKFGWIFIQAFFVLSGYLISKILIEQKKGTGTFKEKFKTYWIRRALRIFPLYYFFLFVLFIVWLFSNYPAQYRDEIIYLTTYTYNLRLSFLFSMGGSMEAIAHAIPGTRHLWSLSVEEQFYLLLPLLVLTMSETKLKFVTLFFILFGVPFRYLFSLYIGNAEHNSGAVIYLFTISYLDAFFIGVAVNVFNTTQWKNRKLYLLISFVMVIACGFLNFLFNPQMKHSILDYIQNAGYVLADLINYQHVWSYSLWSVFFGLLITVLVADANNRNAMLNRIFRYKLFTAPGKVSYGMYVFNLCLLDLFRHLFHLEGAVNKSDWIFHLLMFSLYCLMVYLVAFLSFRFFESRLLNLKPKYSTAKQSIK